uniref:Uncharacterized protein n=1 Tax=Globodera rostochiensis TaxID=31243 RepID=A0A914I4B6_GLORO
MPDVSLLKMLGRRLFTTLCARHRLRVPERVPCFCYSVVGTNNDQLLRQQIDSNIQTQDDQHELRQMLRTIVDTHLANGQIFFVPWANDRAILTLLSPFKQLTAQGVSLEFLIDACTKSADLFVTLTKNGREAIKKFTIFVECLEMTYEDAMRFYAKRADGLDSVSADSIQQRLSVFLGRGILAGAQLKMLVKRWPDILFMGNPQTMDMFWEEISGFFAMSDMKKLMLNSPQICLLDVEEIVEIYEYIYFHMGIESDELTESTNWLNLRLEQIMARHEFLLKTGKYTFPDPKKPQLKKENPTASRIFDVSDLEFATKVGCVSHEEWIVFQDLRKLEELLSEKERPYERVLPAMRKQFERKVKEAVEKEAGEL